MGLARSTYYDEPELQPIGEARLVEQIKGVCAEGEGINPWRGRNRSARVRAGELRRTYAVHESGRADTVITLNGADILTLKNIVAATLVANDFQFV